MRKSELAQSDKIVLLIAGLLIFAVALKLIYKRYQTINKFKTVKPSHANHSKKSLKKEIESSDRVQDQDRTNQFSDFSTESYKKKEELDLANFNKHSANNIKNSKKEKTNTIQSIIANRQLLKQKKKILFHAPLSTQTASKSKNHNRVNKNEC